MFNTRRPKTNTHMPFVLILWAPQYHLGWADKIRNQSEGPDNWWLKLVNLLIKPEISLCLIHVTRSQPFTASCLFISTQPAPPKWKEHQILEVPTLVSQIISRNARPERISPCQLECEERTTKRWSRVKGKEEKTHTYTRENQSPPAWAWGKINKKMNQSERHPPDSQTHAMTHSTKYKNTPLQDYLLQRY